MTGRKRKDDNEFQPRVKKPRTRAERDEAHRREVEGYKDHIRRAINDDDSRPILASEWRRLAKTRGATAMVDAIDECRDELAAYNARTSSDIPSTTKERTTAAMKDLRRRDFEKRKAQGLDDARRIVDEGRLNRDQSNPSGDWNPGAQAPVRRKRGRGGNRPPYC